MNPTEIAAAVGAGAVAAIVAATLVVQAWAKLTAQITELKATAKKAATSAQKVDESLHATNSGHNVKDYMNRSEELFSRMIEEFKGVKRLTEDTNRDVQQLQQSTNDDRAATRRELSEIRGSVAEIKGGLAAHVAEVPALVETAKQQAIRELGLTPPTE